MSTNICTYWDTGCDFTPRWFSKSFAESIPKPKPIPNPIPKQYHQGAFCVIKEAVLISYLTLETLNKEANSYLHRPMLRAKATRVHYCLSILRKDFAAFASVCCYLHTLHPDNNTSRFHYFCIHLALHLTSISSVSWIMILILRDPDVLTNS